VALLPLPTTGKNLHRLKRLFRYDVYQRYYGGAPGTAAYIDSMRQRLKDNPRFFEEALTRIAAELEQTTRSVYGSRDQRFLIDAMPALLAEVDEPSPRPANSTADGPS